MYWRILAEALRGVAIATSINLTVFPTSAVWNGLVVGLIAAFMTAAICLAVLRGMDEDVD